MQRSCHILCKMTCTSRLQDASTPLPKSWRSVGSGTGDIAAPPASRQSAGQPVLAEIGDLWHQVGSCHPRSCMTPACTCYAPATGYTSIICSALPGSVTNEVGVHPLQFPPVPASGSAAVREPEWHAARPHLTAYDVLQVPSGCTRPAVTRQPVTHKLDHLPGPCLM